jgi:purine-nucleoside/S-methyl-5'-thioadenosine phosphorylase / adenosine deaminase
VVHNIKIHHLQAPKTLLEGATTIRTSKCHKQSNNVTTNLNKVVVFRKNKLIMKKPGFLKQIEDKVKKDNPSSVYPNNFFGKKSKVLNVISTRHGGLSTGHLASLNMSFKVGDKPESVIENRRRFGKEAGFKASSLVIPNMSHGTNVTVVKDIDRGRGAKTTDYAYSETDALITNVRRVPLGITVADCVPVSIYDPVINAVGIAHAGWRGSLGDIAGTLMKRMSAEFNANPITSLAWIGPCISVDNYEVGDELVNVFKKRFPYFTNITKDKNLDLKMVNYRQLQEAGLKDENIFIDPVCTFSKTDNFYSHRAENGQTGRMLAVIMLR